MMIENIKKKDIVRLVILMIIMFSFWGWMFYGKSMYCPNCHVYLFYDTDLVGKNIWNGNECLNCGQKVNYKTAEWLYPWQRQRVVKGNVIK